LSILKQLIRHLYEEMVSRKTAPDLPAFLFDLDGTLIDSVYDHVETWAGALSESGITVAKWKLHRRIGMSGQSFLQELLRESGQERVSPKKVAYLEQLQGTEFSKKIPRLKPTAGARDLLRHLSSIGVRWAIVSTGKSKQTLRLLKLLSVPRHVPVVTGDDVDKTKPAPDAFVVAAERLRVSIEDSIVVGDSVWDLLAAGRRRALAIGLLCGGSGQDELERAGAFRVYADPADLLTHLEQLGVPGPRSR
jgi:HAD superfamily hydrolase (TIGR01509 family)